MTSKERELLERIAELGGALAEPLLEAAKVFDRAAARLQVLADSLSEPAAPAPPEKRCEECGEVLVLRPPRKGRRSESPEQFARRRFCDQKCAGRARRKVKDAPDTKTCLQCGEEFSRRKSEGASRFADRKFCSQACFFASGAAAKGRRPARPARRPQPAPAAAQPAAKKASPPPQPARWAPAPEPAAERPSPSPSPAPKPRTCPACGQPLTRRPGEKLARFRDRKFCNRECFQRLWEQEQACAQTGRPRGSERQRNSRGLALPDKTTPPLEDLGKRRDYGRVQPLGEPCEKHPSYVIGFYGCAACNSGRKWAEAERQLPLRPRPEGGR